MFEVGSRVRRISDEYGGMKVGDIGTVKRGEQYGHVLLDEYKLTHDVRKLELVESPLNVQVGGDHYKKLKIQPVEYIMANNIPYMEGNVVKYVTRWRDKGGIADLEKAMHYLQMLIEQEKKNA